VAETVFYDEKNMQKKSFKTTWIWKNAKKFSKKRALISNHPQNRRISELFFHDSFLKLNSLQFYVKKITFWFTKICHVPKLIFKIKINRNFLLWLDLILNILLFSLSDINHLNKFVVKKNWIKTRIGVSTKIPHYINNFWWLNFSYFNFNFLFKYYDYFSYIICQFFLNMCILLSF
jgi:hypothetical protein